MDLPFASAPEEVGFDSKALQRLVRWQQHLYDSKRLPFTQIVVGRKGKVAHFSTVGQRDVKAGIAAEPDTICRMFSMTKPITSCALMMLYEEGRFLLSDPVHLYLGPKWHKKNMTVYKSGDAETGWSTEPCKKQITVRDVLCHTSGLTYGFDMKGLLNKVDGIYTKVGLGLDWNKTDVLLAEFVDKLAEAPLQFQPGSAWNYGYNVEVSGRLVEVLSGQPLDEFFQERILRPLRMVDTGFAVPPEKRNRFARLYMREGGLAVMGGASPGVGRDAVGLKDITEKSDSKRYTAEYKFFEAGGGLAGTISDYARFCQMLLNGGELDGKVVLSRKTIDWMTVNHLVDNSDMSTMVKNAGGYAETAQDGVGFGLGFSVVMDPAKSGQINSRNTFSWGGAASTLFWCDPMEDLFVVFTTQLMYNDPLVMPLRFWLGNLVYGCLKGDRDPSRSRTLALPQSKL